MASQEKPTPPQHPPPPPPAPEVAPRVRGFGRAHRATAEVVTLTRRTRRSPTPRRCGSSGCSRCGSTAGGTPTPGAPPSSPAPPSSDSAGSSRAPTPSRPALSPTPPTPRRRAYRKSLQASPPRV
ncbi:hypothetical protein OsJ_21533 [Oryza sativa Japonica Group]|uniref:Uncharacterized protein n=2 Tax=Oryza sativa subsp. japonica TaxID=39947 RepID=B9FTJ3_ORYSJ|nr:hypothetical protein OsJ_21533 [Oryza sativa Japonica Group]BAD45685.1 unknown protein [Oryza sativa Japonica Group]BAG99773.1 unnamed protein product [Oryza sativa Japonica Group]